MRLPRPSSAAIAAALAVIAFVAGTTAGCGGATGSTQPSGRTIKVPSQRPTIQAGVAAARPGDIVLVAPGTYHESITIERRGVTLRGEDRNGVTVDGEYSRENGITVAADEVTVENLTVHGFNANGIYVSGAAGRSSDPSKVYGSGNDVRKAFRVSYVTVYDNGLYGVYAFASRFGQIDHVLASGHPDSGIYIGQCRPCDTIVTDSIAEHNAIGYYGTNASGGVYVVRSIFRNNRVGATPNSQRMEKLAPQAETVVAGNLVVDNDDPQSPPVARGAFAVGIVVGGGTKNTVVRNRVQGHDGAGIVVSDLDDYEPENNRVEANVLAGNGVDLAYAMAAGTGAAGNCFTGNQFSSSRPDAIEKVLPCDGSPAGALSVAPFRYPPSPPGPNFRTIPAPPPQPSMPDPTTAPAAIPHAVAPTVDVASIVAPPAS